MFRTRRNVRLQSFGLRSNHSYVIIKLINYKSNNNQGMNSNNNDSDNNNK